MVNAARWMPRQGDECKHFMRKFPSSWLIQTGATLMSTNELLHGTGGDEFSTFEAFKL
jgi:hypothetical protein